MSYDANGAPIPGLYDCPLCTKNLSACLCPIPFLPGAIGQLFKGTYPMNGATSANDRQVGGDHYKAHPIEPWDYIARNGIGYLAGNVIKYVTRANRKGGLQDLEKARHYLDKLIELEREEK